MGVIAAEMSFCVPVLNWAAEGPEWVADGTPRFDLTYIDTLTRRRLSNLARMALHVAGACVGEARPLRTVFASRHGELHRTMTMLEGLGRSEPLSPTAFGLSVHNAAAGIFSIARQDRSSVTAVAAGEDTLAYALLEASVQLALDPNVPVLLVYADEPIPSGYAQFADCEEHAHALAMLLSPSGQRSITLRALRAQEPPSKVMQSIAFLPCLTAGRSGRWTGIRHTWQWH